MKIPWLEPGNIWSGSKTLAVFTNPTELAFKKGNLKNHYPIVWNDTTYSDVEEAYHDNIPERMCDRVNLITKLIEVKLKTYPIILNTIKANGGVVWLKKCSHWTNSKRKSFQFWEGDGDKSPFIRCLINAFINITENGD